MYLKISTDIEFDHANLIIISIQAKYFYKKMQ